ncbi:MAG: TIGR03621 family F420-dependent LLM class oxidoreductase [Dehalococcoidia bacterium]|nr:TIGR03621 family F420-dependent LLM class oxidoreductase [Dehalococcoidia bacterium]
MARPFRFSARVPDFTTSSQWKDDLARIEDSGYSTISVPDHFMGPAGYEPFTYMAAIAVANDRLRIVSLVAGNDYRHPVVLHKSAANIDLFSGGRLELGIGAGWMLADYEAAGIAYDAPGIRVSRFEESVRVIKGLFAPGPFSFEGKHYRITNLDGLPEPVQKPHPPILIGGGGKRLLSFAAREADIIGVNTTIKDGVLTPSQRAGFNADLTDTRVGWVNDAMRACGRSLDDVELQAIVYHCVVTSSQSETDAALGRLSALYELPPAELNESPAVLVGTVDACVDRLRERRDRWGINYVTINDVAEGAPIVSKLAGA